MGERRCIHRHTIKTHPNCFRKGLIKPETWWEGKKIGYFDIETTNLKANFGVVLSWCLKYENDKDIRYSLITKDELFNLKFDKRVVQELVEELKNVDILVTYFGKNFDVKYIRTKALYWGVDFPQYGSIYHWDVYYHVKKNLKLHRHSLDVVTNYLGIKGKTPLEWDTWLRAQYGDKKALNNVLKHNKGDVVILEKLHKKLGGFSKWIRSSI